MKHTGSENFYSVEHLVQRYDGTLQAGRYAYPFSLELSENIPGSFESSSHDAKIEYKLAAYFSNYHESNNKELEYIPLHIREPFRQEMVSYQGASVQEPSSCGCCSKGTVQLEAKFDSNPFTIQEMFAIKVKISLLISESITLVGIVTLTAF